MCISSAFLRNNIHAYNAICLRRYHHEREFQEYSEPAESAEQPEAAEAAQAAESAEQPAEPAGTEQPLRPLALHQNRPAALRRRAVFCCNCGICLSELTLNVLSYIKRRLPCQTD